MSKKIDLSDIKENDLDETSSFTDLMTKKQRKNRINSSDIDEMINEKKKDTSELSKELMLAKEKYNQNFEEDIKKEQKIEEIEKQEKEENLAKTQVLELTRQMKFNFEENKQENIEKQKNGLTLLNIIGILNLICIGCYIYLLTFTDYVVEQEKYLISGGFIVLLVLLFGLSVVTNKKVSKFFKILNIIAIISFIGFGIYTFI